MTEENKDAIPGGVSVERGGPEIIEDSLGVVVEVPTSNAVGDVQDGEPVELIAEVKEGQEACAEEFGNAPVMHKTPSYRARRYNQKERQ